MIDKGPMKQPEFCPNWVYLLMHQCWAFDSVQRPPFLAIFDCLTSRYLKNYTLFTQKLLLVTEQVKEGDVLLIKLLYASDLAPCWLANYLDLAQVQTFYGLKQSEF